MAITPLPTPPSRNDPTNFSTRADAFLGALPDFATEANALAVDVNLDAVAAAAAEVAATAAAAAATAAANVTKWVSGTTYAEGVVVWSPITYLSYRRKTAGAGTTDPSADSTNWAQAAGTGDVLSSAAVFTGSITEGVYTLAGTALDPANGTVQIKTLSANTTFTDSLTSGQSIILGIDDGSAYTVTWPTITWTTNPIAPPTLPTSGYLWIVLWKVGATLYGKY